MSMTEAIAQIGLGHATPQIDQLGMSELQIAARSSRNSGVAFEAVLSGSLGSVNEKIATAEDMVRQFAVDDSIPLHQVTLALEEARLSVELAMQVRARLVETYREFMNMQL